MTKNKYRYYSQHGEDFLLWKFFNYAEGGFFVDVGAFDGVHLSNSFSFEQQEWTGICVEPHPSYFPLCEKSRPGSICLNVACVGSDKLESVDFYAEVSGLYSGMIGGREEEIAHMYKHGWGIESQGFERITVPASTLNAILSEHLPAGTEISFISIDVEGTELDVLHGLDLSRFIPRVLVIEADTEIARQDISNYLRQFGYVEARQLRINTFYARSLEDIEALQRIEVEYHSEKNLHPLGEEFTLRQFRRSEDRSEKILYYKELEQQKEYLKQQREQLENQREQLKNKDEQLNKQSEQLKEQDETIREYREHLEQQNEILRKYQEEQEISLEQLNRLRAETENLKLQLDEILQSRSSRMTALIRKVRSIIRIRRE
jgi:FkbM family methyltransferase